MFYGQEAGNKPANDEEISITKESWNVMAIVGVITEEIIALLKLSVPAGTPIYLGSSNIAHMQEKHPEDYEKYGADLPSILAAPDYVGQNPKDGSIEYVKDYVVNGEYVKVAVRISVSGRYFARSMYVLNPNRVQNFIRKGTLKRT